MKTIESQVLVPISLQTKSGARSITFNVKDDFKSLLLAIHDAFVKMIKIDNFLNNTKDFTIEVRTSSAEISFNDHKRW